MGGSQQLVHFFFFFFTQDLFIHENFTVLPLQHNNYRTASLNNFQIIGITYSDSTLKRILVP